MWLQDMMNKLAVDMIETAIPHKLLPGPCNGLAVSLVIYCW